MKLTLENYIENVQNNAVDTGLTDFRLAREEFHKLAGEFEEGESWFEVRMTMFLDWYLLERKGQDELTPNQRYMKEFGHLLSEVELQQHELLNVTLRSTFQIISKLKDDWLLLEDIISGGHWKAKWTLPAVGLKADDILNSRLIMHNDNLQIGRGAVLHPSEAHDVIFEIIERAKKELFPPQKLVYYLDKAKLKLDRYSNVKIRHVYKYPTEVVF